MSLPNKVENWKQYHMARVAGKLDITELKHSITSLDPSSDLAVNSTGLKICGEGEGNRQKIHLGGG